MRGEKNKNKKDKHIRLRGQSRINNVLREFWQAGRYEAKMESRGRAAEDAPRPPEVVLPDVTPRWSEHVGFNWSALAHVQKMKCDEWRAGAALP